MADTKTTAETRAARAATKVWTDEERAAMKDSARERKATSRRDPAEERAAGEADVQAKIAAMPAADRAMGERIHALRPRSRRRTLVPRTYYGMPAYAKDGKVICFYKPASKFQGAVLDVRVPAGRVPSTTATCGRCPSRSLEADAPPSEKQIAGLVKQAAR